MTAFDVAAAAPWAMLPERVEQVLRIAAREHEVTPEALEAYRGMQIPKGERVRMRDGTAVLYVSGPLFKRANLFVEMSGATSYDILRRDLQVAMDDPAIHSVAFLIDSPGGEASGVDELASAIFAYRGKKPMTAFVSGQAASAAYWIASAADRVVVSEAAIVGSIGVVLGITDTSGRDEKSGVRKIEFVSSQSPGKRPDVASDEGRARIQKMVDDLAAVFIGAVAKHRGVSVETVIGKFGGGGVEIGASAVAVGMADAIGSFEAELSALKKSGMAPRNRFTGGLTVSDNTTAPAADAGKTPEQLVAEATAAAQARIKGIIECADGVNYPNVAKHLAFNTSLSVESATGILQAVAKDCNLITTAATVKTDTAKSFAEQKAEAGAIVTNQPIAQPAPNENSAAGWGKAIAAANKRFDTAAA